MSNRALSAAILLDRAPMGEIWTANDSGTRVQFVQEHRLFKKRKVKSLGSYYVPTKGKSLSLTHYSSQFNNRELARCSRTSEVSSCNQRLDSRCGRG